jgi:hypothetical protein
MLRLPKQALLTALVLAPALTGCVDNESSLFVEGVLSLPASDCVAQPDADAEFIPLGVLDRQFAHGYVAAVQVGNQLTQQGNREKLRTETSRLRLEGAKGSVFGTDGSEHPFEAIATGFVHPASGTEPGLAAMFVQLVNEQDLASLGTEGQIIVRFRVFGTTLGGQEIESGDFDYPIFMCDGCLVRYPIDANIAPIGEAYACGVTAMATTEETTICYYGQDQNFDCTACASTSTICQDPSQNPWYN